MQALATNDYQSMPVPRRVKISSKRQITIPVDIYERQGFAEYALLSETPDGLVIQPIELTDDDEELTVRLLRFLIEQGCEGEELLQRYSEMKPKFISFFKAVERSEKDIAEGCVRDFGDVQQEMREKYGL